MNYLKKETTYGIYLIDGFSQVSDEIFSWVANFTEGDERTEKLILSIDNIGEGIFLKLQGRPLSVIFLFKSLT